jgi:hypothetical protein
VKAQFPAIKVTLVSSAKTLMPVGYNKGLGKNLQGQLESIGVELVFNTRLDSKGLKTGAIEKQFVSSLRSTNMSIEAIRSLLNTRCIT